MNESPLFSCPVSPSNSGAVVSLALGEGGRPARQFIRDRILAAFNNPWLAPLDDGACVIPDARKLIVTTDSYVVSPRFFPGGNIGTLAVYGTVNDLVVSGALPRWLTLSMMIEEGFSLDELDLILSAIADAARTTGVQIVTGDTKVVPRGAVDGLFLNTTGIGELQAPAPAGPTALQPGDKLLVSGPIGQHGVSIMSLREGFEFDPPPRSDCGPLLAAVQALRSAEVSPRCMRDATRGGVAAVLQEWAEASERTLTIEESRLPVTPEVHGVCELLGLDPVHLACEGTMLLAVPAEQVQAALAALQSVSTGKAAAEIGQVCDRKHAAVTVVRAGRELPLDEPAGPLLPRIC